MDPATVAGFGDEWVTFDQSSLPDSELDAGFRVKVWVSAAVAVLGYWPTGDSPARALALGPRSAHNHPLVSYARRSLYTMRTDAYDRFATRLEQRFTRAEIATMMRRAGLRDIRFSEGEPYWCAVGVRG